MPDPIHKPPKPKSPVVVPIKKAKRLYHQERPALEPPSEMMGLWTKGVSESNLAVIEEAYIRSEIEIGDPCLVVLRKVRYILENVSAAFTDPAARKELVLAMVGVIKDYGEPEGIPLLEKARERFGSDPEIGERISNAISLLSPDTRGE